MKSFQSPRCWVGRKSLLRLARAAKLIKHLDIGRVELGAIRVGSKRLYGEPPHCYCQANFRVPVPDSGQPTGTRELLTNLRLVAGKAAAGEVWPHPLSVGRTLGQAFGKGKLEMWNVVSLLIDPPRARGARLQDSRKWGCTHG